MNDGLTNRRLTPKMVVTIYSAKHGGDYYLEQRAVNMVRGETVLMAPVPMPDDALKDVAKVYMRKNSADMDNGGWIAPHMLYGLNRPGRTEVMWYRPAMLRSLNWSKELGIKGDKVIVPATLYVIVKGNLYVWALMDDGRPSMETKLYNAPFFNIYADGRVCMGTARTGKIKAKTFAGEAERFERAFYMAEQNGGQSEKNCKTPLGKLWKGIIARKSMVFPAKTELIQHRQYKTVGDVVRKLLNGNANITENNFNDEDDDE